MDSKPELDVLITHARATKWRTLGVKLDLEPNRLDAIKKENQDEDERLSKMYELWLATNPNATYNDVIKALESESLQEITVAHNLKEYLQKGRLCIQDEKYKEQDDISLLTKQIAKFVHILEKKGQKLEETSQELEKKGLCIVIIYCI